MALITPLTLDNGLTAPAAYARIKEYTGNKFGIAAFVEFYSSQAAREATLPVVLERRFILSGTPTGEVLPWLYAELRSFEDFKTAVDA